MISVEYPVGGGIGWSNCQTHVHGDWPEFGLSGHQRHQYSEELPWFMASDENYPAPGVA